MPDNKVVSHEQWLKARLELLAAEKKFTRQRDALTRRRMAMPWERVEKSYQFEGSNGALSLADLFDGRSQLIVYHADTAVPAQYPRHRAECVLRRARPNRRGGAAAWSCRSPTGRVARKIRRGKCRARGARPQLRQKIACSRRRSAPARAQPDPSTARTCGACPACARRPSYRRRRSPWRHASGTGRSAQSPARRLPGWSCDGLEVADHQPRLSVRATASRQPAHLRLRVMASMLGSKRRSHLHIAAKPAKSGHSPAAYPAR